MALLDGGGLNNFNSSPIVTNCMFAVNDAPFGGAMFNNAGGNPVVTGCAFFDNAANFGGAMWSGPGSTAVSNCTFVNNTAVVDGGGMNNVDDSTVIVDNCVLWGNSPDQILDFGTAMTTVGYSDVQGGWPGTGNIDADPLFVDPLGGNVRLSSGSPCIDAADNTAVAPDATDLDGDADTGEATPFDLDGDSRFLDDPDTPDTGVPGNGFAEVVDMGAFEFGTAPAPLGDLDGDGSVGINDFLLLLGAWGPCDAPCPPSCAADLDADCNVGITDLLILLGNWG